MTQVASGQIQSQRDGDEFQPQLSAVHAPARTPAPTVGIGAVA
jgi:hypothetical protein